MLKQKYGDDVVVRPQVRPEEADRSSTSRRRSAMFKFWGELLGAARRSRRPTSPPSAIVYVDGPIVLGSGEAVALRQDGGPRSARDIRKALDEAPEDDSIKAVVLRVDSPGGSAVASEIILDATRGVKAKKPFIVSMGNVAGSGGYYVACGADTIFADETHDHRLDRRRRRQVRDRRRCGTRSASPSRPTTAARTPACSPASETVHRRASASRCRPGWTRSTASSRATSPTTRGNRLKKPIDELAGGRVYTGQQALELGLVDQIGTLHDAIEHVAAEAKLSRSTTSASSRSRRTRSRRSWPP